MTYAEQRSQRLGMTRCPACPGTCPVIAPDGPPNSPYLFIGEAPGKEENARGRPFIGQTGKEFNNHYLPLSGLTRDDIRITNTVKCYTEDKSNSAKFQNIKDVCSRFHLRQEMSAQRPAVVVPMGAVACSINESINLEMHHGIPQLAVDWFGHRADTFPMWHPASGLHQTESMVPLQFDFIELGRFLRGEANPPVDAYPHPIYEELESKSDVQNCLDSYEGLDLDCNMDTETDPAEGFWCLTFSLAPGTGYMIRRVNKDGIGTYSDWVRSQRSRKFVFHNGMFDLPVLQAVGINIPWKQFDDTMVRAYHLQYLPQGLKALAYRLCGMQMEAFEDVVLPYAVDVMMDYIVRISCIEWPKPEEQVKFDKGEFKIYKPQSLSTKLKRLMTDFNKNPTHKIFDRWGEWTPEEKLPVIAQFGDLPKPSIKYVPKNKAIYYACRDADATGRVKAALVRLRRQIRRVAALHV